MNKSLVIASVLMAAALTTGIFSTHPMAAYAEDDYDGDSSETNTEQSIKQENVGSGESTNFNCGDNDINSVSEARIDVDACGTLEINEEDGVAPPPPPPPPP
jgi:hypothetical protein